MEYKISLYVDKEMKEWIKKNAISQRRSMNSIILIMLDFFKQNPEISGLKEFEEDEKKEIRLKGNL